jgi:hypothetical protein
MAEKLTLASPVTPTVPAITEYSVRSIYLGRDEERIAVVVRDNNGHHTTCVYEGATAVTLMGALNRANLTSNSLQRRVLAQLAADGKLPGGTVTGTQD